MTIDAGGPSILQLVWFVAASIPPSLCPRSGKGNTLEGVSTKDPQMICDVQTATPT
jgi:hypothetical protein